MKILIDSIDNNRETKKISVDEDFCITIPSKNLAIEIKCGMFSPDGVVIDLWKEPTEDDDIPMRSICISNDELEEEE